MVEHERVAAEFAADLDLEDVPDSIKRHARMVIADTIGAIVGGSTDDTVSTLAAESEARYPGESPMLGTPHETVPPRAALFGGTAGTVLELDEGNRFAGGHPAIHVLPALIGDSALNDEAERFFSAFVAGYEVVARVGSASTPLKEHYHPHGVWGGVGAAAAVSHYRGFDANTTLGAMRIAANNAQHTRFEAATEGATVRNTYAGMSNMTGLVAADLVESGFTGVEDGITLHLDFLAEDGFDAPALSADLGEFWELSRSYYKIHAACRYIHPTLDAIDEADSEYGIDPEHVQEIIVETYTEPAGLTDPRPDNRLAAKFSVPFSVATRLLQGHSQLGAYTDSARTEAAFELAEKVRMVESEEITARKPDARSSRVCIVFDDGTEKTTEVRHARGGSERPIDDEQVLGKFYSLTEPVIGHASAEKVWNRVLELPESNLSSIGDQLTPE